MNQTAKSAEKRSQLVSVALRSIPLNSVLPVNLYLIVDSRPIQFRSAGDSLSADRVKKLNAHNVNSVYVRSEDRKQLREFFWRSFTSNSEESSKRVSAFKQAMHLESSNLKHGNDLGTGLREVFGLFEEAGHTSLFADAPMSTFLDKEAQGIPEDSHSVNVTVYSLALARKVFSDPASISKVGAGAMIHDIGETRIDIKLRQQADLLRKEDYKEAQKHTIYGLDYLKGLPNIPTEVAKVVAQHHENYDGTGYPNGLQRDQIHLMARVVSICDLFDTLTALDAPQPMSPQEALKMMTSMQPGRFDPDIFNVFTKNV